MKVRVLGCGTSSGVPRLGSGWGACDPAEPRNRRTRAAILVDSGGETLLVDCGPDLRAQLFEAGVERIDRVFVTHDHADHCHGIDELRPLAQRRGSPIPLFAHPETMAALTRRFAYVFTGGEFYRPMLAPVAVSDGFDHGDARVRLVAQPHGAIFSSGMRFDEAGKSLVYAIDFHEMTDAMKALYAGAGLMICDCLRREAHPTHAHLDAVLGWARELRVGQLLLSHLDASMDYKALAATLPDWAAPAHDGLEVSL